MASERPKNPYQIVRIRRLADRKVWLLFPHTEPVYELELTEIATGKRVILSDANKRKARNFLGAHYHVQDEWDIRQIVNAGWPGNMGQWQVMPAWYKGW